MPPAMLPRRFRTRVLAAIALTGTCLLVGVYHAPGKVREPARLWTLLWTASEKEICPDVPRKPPATDRRWKTADIYPNLSFEVPDNGGMGLWNDALEMRYRKIRKNWKNLPLKVIVVPHSHVDAGWLRTFDDYFTQSVAAILDEAVAFLNGTDDFRFVWAEVSFFAKWWERQTESTRSTVKQILDKRRLEFVTGGWVMPDEAVTTYYATIDQLIEGHQWLRHFVGVKPTSGWSVDVFGHSASYPYFLSAAGITETVVMRTHYAWKRFLAEAQSLDFYWEQARDSSSRVLCHMAPSDLYSFKYACGPDPFVCLQFDFRRVDLEYSESTAVEITSKNVAQKAGHLLTQYGRFASLYPHNVLLVPLGDDFRYNLDLEWIQQRENYRKLFDYINSQKEWHAHVQFGTVSDYFEEVRRRMLGNDATLRSIEGDFLPYADIYANFRPSYWTGFYTSRVLYKKLSRELEYWIRTSEILYSLSKTLVSGRVMAEDYSSLVSARHALGLFQHHDAITGTSKELVMGDYGKKLHVGLMDAMSIVSHVTQSLLMKPSTAAGLTWTSRIYPDAYRSAFDQPTRKLSVSVPQKNGRKIVLFNSLSTERTEVVKIKVKSPLVRVVDSRLMDVAFQVNPVFKDGLSVSSTVFELLFVASMKPLAYSVYTIMRAEEKDYDKLTKTVVSISLLNNDAMGSHMAAFTFQKPENEEEITFESRKVILTFSSNGRLKTLYLKDSGLSKTLDVDFLTYHSWLYRSGAYLFNPDAKATPVRNQTGRLPTLAVIRGPVVSELTVAYQDFLKFSARLYHFENAPAAVQLEIASNVSRMSTEDLELITRIRSDIKNSGEFYTDSNGFQMLKRKYVVSLPVQGNYYPATTAVYVEDSELRLNVLLPHSHGVTSSGEGEVEIMLDRKIRHDDGRGLGEGLEDSRGISTVMWVLPEPRRYGIGLTSDAFWLSLALSNPLIVLVSDYSDRDCVKDSLSFLERPWPSDVHLVTLRTLPSNKNYSLPSNDSLMIVHQTTHPCPSGPFVDRFIDAGEHSFSMVKMQSVTRTLLTGDTAVPGENAKEASPSLLQTCKISFK